LARMSWWSLIVANTQRLGHMASSNSTASTHF
jgi:hypothetical protein